MNKDQMRGRVKATKGAVKAATGKAVGNKKLENTGNVEKAAGKVQAGYGDLKNGLVKK